MSGRGEITSTCENWNQALVSSGGHLLQSWQWGELKRASGWDVNRFAVSTGASTAMAQVLVRAKGPVSIAYVPRGPAITGHADIIFPKLMHEVDLFCRKHRALGLILEPDVALDLPGSYRGFGFVRGSESLQPSRTVKVPLLPDDELLAQMHQKNRYNVRLAIRRGVEIERVSASSLNLNDFYALLCETASRNEFGVHEFAYYERFMSLFGEDAALFFARANGRIAATGIAARFGEQGVYMYGASSTENRADGAAFLLQYGAMRWARDRGARTYDLWGIPPDDPVIAKGKPDQVTRSQGEDWRGLYTFKVRFGGEIVSYPPPLERRYHPLLMVAASRLMGLRSG